MKLVYYFTPSRMKREKTGVQSIYGSNITYINDKQWTMDDMFKKGNILICGSVDELIDTESDVNQIDKEYMFILGKEVELVFDKPTQCNSLIIKTLIDKNNNLNRCYANV